MQDTAVSAKSATPLGTSLLLLLQTLDIDHSRLGFRGSYATTTLPALEHAYAFLELPIHARTRFKFRVVRLRRPHRRQVTAFGVVKPARDISLLFMYPVF